MLSLYRELKEFYFTKINSLHEEGTMEITYPFAKVFTDNTNKLNVFFLHDTQHTTFEQIGDIGNGIVDFCELDFTEVLQKIKTSSTITVSEQNFENIKNVFWNAVDLLKGNHSYAHFFLNSEILRTFYASQKTKVEMVDYLIFLFDYYANLQKTYSDALEMCLNKEVLTEYTLAERYMMFCNLTPSFTHHMLRSMYGIAPISYGKFDTSKLIAFDDPKDVDTRKVLQNIHRDSDHEVSMWQYFAIQSLEEMLYLEFMEMIKRGILVKRCGLCDKLFVLADKRKRDYCDRIYKNNRTCKQVGAKMKFNKSVEEDKFLQDFQRIYNRMYSRFYRFEDLEYNETENSLTKEEFKAWVATASKARQDYKVGEISGDEMIDALSKSTEY